MNLLILIEFVVITCLQSLVSATRLSVTTYKNEKYNNCDTTLDLSDTGLDRLGANFTNSNCVKSLILRNNNIEDFEEGIFDSHPYLEYLDLSRNKLELRKFFSYGGQASLKVFILDDNNYNIPTTITRNKSDSDEDDDGTKIFEYNSKQLYVSEDYPELKYLSLRNVQIDSFSENWISHFPKLYHLDLSENALPKDVSNILLKTITPTIGCLILEDTGLTMVRTEQLNYIEELNLNRNWLPRLSSHKCHDNTLCLENMDNLKILHISNCSVTYIEENAFKYMQQLQELDVSNNCFRQIPDKTFNYVPSLTSLDISSNSLYYLPNINSLQNLTSLSLNDMKIKKMLQSLQMFPILPKLKFLSLRGNRLSNISSTLFNNLINLENLDLSNNQFASLPSWDTQKSLRSLHLNFNKIEAIEDISINDAKSLELLALKNNSISHMKVSSLRSLPSNNVVLNL